MTQSSVSPPLTSDARETSLAKSTPAVVSTPTRLNHVAYVTHDLPATVDFYTRVMKMPLVNVVTGGAVKSTGLDVPYVHLFFRMQDGSTVAFFESPGLLPAPKPPPAYEIFNHLALNVDTVEEVYAWRDWLLECGVDEVIGPVDYTFALSVYFHDPSGHRLEITTEILDDATDREEWANKTLDAWLVKRAEAERAGSDVAQELAELASLNSGLY